MDKLSLNIALPDPALLEQELNRQRYIAKYCQVVKSTIYSLITVAAIAILIATLFLPVLQIYGTSMTPSLYEGNIVISVKGNDFKKGDIVSFYYNNKILVKRVIAYAGEWVDIDEDGNVYVNEERIDEPYVDEKAFGTCDIKLPYQVPEDKIFVMGDHRATSSDSRSSAVGCVSDEQLVGKIVFRIWPFSEFGSVN